MSDVFELFPAVRTAVVQMGPEVAPEPGGLTSVLGSTVGAFLTTLIVGAILVAIAPSYTQDGMADVLENPVGSFLYGLAVLLVLLVVMFVLVITVIGVVLAIPLAVLASWSGQSAQRSRSSRSVIDSSATGTAGASRFLSVRLSTAD